MIPGMNNVLSTNLNESFQGKAQPHPFQFYFQLDMKVTGKVGRGNINNTMYTATCM